MPQVGVTVVRSNEIDGTCRTGGLVAGTGWAVGRRRVEVNRGRAGIVAGRDVFKLAAKPDDHDSQVSGCRSGRLADPLHEFQLKLDS